MKKETMQKNGQSVKIMRMDAFVTMDLSERRVLVSKRTREFVVGWNEPILMPNTSFPKSSKTRVMGVLTRIVCVIKITPVTGVIRE